MTKIVEKPRILGKTFFGKIYKNLYKILTERSFWRII